VALVASVSLAVADDGLLGNRGGSSGGSSGSGGGKSDPPIRTEPPPKRSHPDRVRERDRDRDSDYGSWPRRTGSGGSVIRERGPAFPNRPGRNGYSQYGTSSNRSLIERVLLPPVPVRGNQIQREIFNEDRIQRVGQITRYRDGYYYYDQRWRDDSFYYPYYRFGYTPDSVPAPWYSYPHLPAYVAFPRIQLWSDFHDWDYGDSYRWTEPREFDATSRFRNNPWNDNYSELDYAVDDIKEAFELRRVNEMASLIGESGNVGIEIEGEWAYSIHPDDFFDMMRDLVETTATASYRIDDVRRSRSSVVVIAKHIFRDPWGYDEVRYHKFELREGRRGYEITVFSISDDRFRIR
jgi:hypothetical protein